MSVNYVTCVHAAEECISWSQCGDTDPCLAIAGQSLSLYNAACSERALPSGLATGSNSTAAHSISFLAWQPSQPTLALGSKQGRLVIYSLETHEHSEDTRCHTCNITHLLWNKTGTVLASGDHQGNAALWSLDTHCKLCLLAAFKAAPTGPISALLFHELAAIPALFYSVTTDTGTDVYLGDSKQDHSNLYSVPSPTALLGLFWCDVSSQLVTVAASGELFVHGTNAQAPDKWDLVVKLRIGAGVKSAAADSKLMVAWVAGHTLASASGQDGTIRMYNLETEDNYVLQIEQASTPSSDVVSCLHYFSALGLLVAGTTAGEVVMWSYSGQQNRSAGSSTVYKDSLQQDPTACWKLQKSVHVEGQVNAVACSLQDSLLAVQSDIGVHICQRGLLQRQTRAGIAAVQLAAHNLAVQSLQGTRPVHLTTQLPIKGLDVSETHALVSSDAAAELHHITAAPKLAFAFSNAGNPTPVLYGQLLFRLQGQVMEVCSMAGIVTQRLQLAEVDGAPGHLDACSGTVLLYTKANKLCLWRIQGDEAIPVAGSGKAVDLPPDLTVISMRCSCDGSKVSLLTRQKSSSGQQAQKVFVYDIQTGVTSVCTFGEGHSPVGQPQQHMWDSAHPLLLACEMSGAADSQPNTVSLVTLFATPHGVVFQDTQLLKDCQGVMAVAAPWVYTFNSTEVAGSAAQTSLVQQSRMQSFEGMEAMDSQTSRALLEFSYHLAVGDMQEAHKAVKLVKTAGQWRSLCLSAVQSRRHQVVQLCLDNMEDAQLAQAVRQFENVTEPDAQLGIVAVQLGQLEDAKKLFAACNRHDLLNKLHQACGDWDQALHVAEQSDKINLKATHCSYAQLQQANGDFETAIKHHQLADTHRHEVPRMLWEANQTDQLGTYVKQMHDPELSRWWGRYCESIGNMPGALEAFQQANDTLALVRLHCRNEDFVAASNLVEERDDAAAAFLLARQLEATEQVAEAVHYFGKAGKSHQGVRLAKQHGMDAELLSLALQSPALLMLDTAEYFEQRGELDKAVLLYQKAGKEKRAVELCFSGRLYETLASIANKLTSTSEPALLARCADYFLEHGNPAKGVEMLLNAKQASRALAICEQQDLPMTEAMADRLSPGQDVAAKERELTLRRIAKLAKHQASFHLACKKYTQAGDKVKALKCLIRSGDTEKITFFAGVCRQAEIYTMAANYLQSLDWHARPDLAQSIVTFYSKAKAWDSLALFYEACAQIEVDDFQDYAKALQALQESLKYVSKSQKADKAGQAASLQTRIAATSAFLEAQHIFSSNPAAAVQICNGLVVQLSQQASDPSRLQAGARIGDVYALLIEYWMAQGGIQQAHQLLERMKLTKVPLEPYIESNVVEAMYKAVDGAQEAS